MKEKLKEIEELIQCTEDTYRVLCKDVGEGFATFQSNVQKITVIMGEILDNAARIQELGVEFPVEVVIQQLTNIAEACEKSDAVMLADTLHYEIKDTLLFYKEIISEMIKENLSF